MEIEQILLGAGITIFSLNLLIVSLLSYRKFRTVKLLIVSGVFLLFFVRGIILSLSLFYTQMVQLDALIYIWFFDLIILILLYIMSLKR